MTRISEQERQELAEVVRESRAALAAQLQAKRREIKARATARLHDDLRGHRCPRCKFTARWFEWGGDRVFGCRTCATTAREPVFRYVDDFVRFSTPELVSDTELVYRGERWTIKEKKQWT